MNRLRKWKPDSCKWRGMASRQRCTPEGDIETHCSMFSREMMPTVPSTEMQRRLRPRGHFACSSIRHTRETGSANRVQEPCSEKGLEEMSTCSSQLSTVQVNGKDSLYCPYSHDTIFIPGN